MHTAHKSEGDSAYLYVQPCNLYSVFVCTKFSHDNTAHYEDRSHKLNVRHISFEDELIEAGCHHSSEAIENDPDGWRHQEKASKVDVVVKSIDH